MAEPFGRYQLLKRIAGGGMGEVFLARQDGIQGFEKLLVIKTLLAHLTESPEFVSMFLDEARLAARLAHPNVIQIYDLGQVEEVFYIAMEYVHGEDLKRLWKQAYLHKRTIPIPIAARIVADAAAGLGYAHRLTDSAGQPLGLVHRDVSPQNILLTFDGGVKLIDFGVAKAAGRATQTQTGALKGKYAYMSPEQVDGQPVDQRSDLFALGIVLWEMTTGTRLFRGDTDVQTLKLVGACQVPPPSQQNPEVPAALDPIILRALARDPAARYPTMDALRLDLENWLAESRSPGSSAHLAGFMRELFRARLEREGNRGPLADVDPDATGFSPLGRTRGGARPRAETGSSQNLVRPAQMSGDLLRPAVPPAGPPKLHLPPAVWGMGAVGLLLLGFIAFALLRPHPPARAQPVAVAPLASPNGSSPAPARPPALARLDVASTPAGAELRVDGQVKGLTPVQALELPAGKPVRLALHLQGYEPVVQEGVALPANLSFTLTPRAPDSVAVALHSQPEGAQVFAGEIALGTTPATWTTAPTDAPVTLTFKRAGYRDLQAQVTPGKQRAVQVKLTALHAHRGHPADPDIKLSR